MAELVTTSITDDLDGSTNATPLRFSVEGKAYLIDLSPRNRAAFDKALARYVQAARRDGGRRRTAATRRPARGTAKAAGARKGGRTLYSKLKAEEQASFRKWAVRRKLTTKTARRIADSAVQAWLDAGRP